MFLVAWFFYAIGIALNVAWVIMDKRNPYRKAILYATMVVMFTAASIGVWSLGLNECG